MDRAFRLLKRATLGAAVLLCLAIPVAGLVSTASGWEGSCPGFTDGQAACPWWQYALNEMFWASFLFVPLLFLAALAWMGMALAQFVAARVSRRKAVAPGQDEGG